MQAAASGSWQQVMGSCAAAPRCAACGLTRRRAPCSGRLQLACWSWQPLAAASSALPAAAAVPPHMHVSSSSFCQRHAAHLSRLRPSGGRLQRGRLPLAAGCSAAAGAAVWPACSWMGKCCLSACSHRCCLRALLPQAAGACGMCSCRHSSAPRCWRDTLTASQRLRLQPFRQASCHLQTQHRQ